MKKENIDSSRANCCQMICCLPIERISFLLLLDCILMQWKSGMGRGVWPKNGKISYWISKTLKKYGHAIACHATCSAKSIDLL